MRIIFLTFFLSLIVSSIFAQDYSYLPENKSIAYEVDYKEQGVFVDSLFVGLRKAGFREAAGVGEFSKERSVLVNKMSIPYGVVVTYNATQIIIRFYARLPKRKSSKAIETIRNDYLSVVQISSR